jgi:hypothetical protein
MRAYRQEGGGTHKKETKGEETEKAGSRVRHGRRKDVLEAKINVLFLHFF